MFIILFGLFNKLFFIIKIQRKMKFNKKITKKIIYSRIYLTILITIFLNMLNIFQIFKQFQQHFFFFIIIFNQLKRLYMNHHQNIFS